MAGMQALPLQSNRSDTAGNLYPNSVTPLKPYPARCRDTYRDKEYSAKKPPVNRVVQTTRPCRQEDDRHPQKASSAAVLLLDRKSTRLNSSHQIISYAVFCLKKKTHTFNNTVYVSLVALRHIFIYLLIARVDHWTALSLLRSLTSNTVLLPVAHSQSRSMHMI